jgi:hypothetical protein
MARDESDREDLLREATALVRRAEIVLENRNEPVFAGFKRDGGFSIYLGADPVYQFDREGRLRRAYVDGLLYRTQGTTLASLTRERTATETVLNRVDLSPEQLVRFLTRTRAELELLAAQFAAADQSRWTMIPDETVRPDIIDRLQTILAGEIHLAPVIAGKR